MAALGAYGAKKKENNAANYPMERSACTAPFFWRPARFFLFFVSVALMCKHQARCGCSSAQRVCDQVALLRVFPGLVLAAGLAVGSRKGACLPAPPPRTVRASNAMLCRAAALAAAAAAAHAMSIWQTEHHDVRCVAWSLRGSARRADVPAARGALRPRAVRAATEALGRADRRATPEAARCSCAAACSGWKHAIFHPRTQPVRS